MSNQVPGDAVPTGDGGAADAANRGGGVTPAALGAPDGRPIEMLYTVDMAVTVELGRTRMPMRELLALRPGKVIELDRSARSPVDIYVNNTLLAHGEVVVVDEELGVRVTEIAGSPAERAAG
ncbi:MAG: flagellar motor switch protein FliN [Acidobacteriota bacterium]|nr:flagellar motor switch protein FliN [Acidobacteriota bacterium]